MTEPKASDDLLRGLGLLASAARKAGRQIQSVDLEKTVNVGAQELVRAVTNVGRTVGSKLEEAVGLEEEPQASADGQEARADTTDDPTPSEDADVVEQDPQDAPKDADQA